MPTSPLTEADQDVRGELTRMIAQLGHAPSLDDLGRRLHRSAASVERSLQRLHDAHALLLHPHRCEPWVVHPFALSPGSCWVEVGSRGWWANCVYCGLGILAALGADGCIHTRIGGERDPVSIEIDAGQVSMPELWFHLSVPVRCWWDNVIHSCASFQPFRSEGDVDAWCARHALPRGAVVPLQVMQWFATDWYGHYLDQPWRKRSADEVKTLFARHGFTGEFWQID